MNHLLQLKENYYFENREKSHFEKLAWKLHLNLVSRKTKEESK
jgi:hypothetical protein